MREGMGVEIRATGVLDQSRLVGIVKNYIFVALSRHHTLLPLRRGTKSLLFPWGWVYGNFLKNKRYSELNLRSKSCSICPLPLHFSRKGRDERARWSVDRKKIVWIGFSLNVNCYFLDVGSVIVKPPSFLPTTRVQIEVGIVGFEWCVILEKFRQLI